MIRLGLSRQLVLLYCSLLLASAGVFAWLQIRSSNLEEQKIVQLLSVDVADNIAARADFADGKGLDADAVQDLFDRLMSVNPSVEVYVLDSSGRILGDAAPPGHVKRQTVDLTPINAWLDGKPAPVFGDDPRSPNARKVFSAARLVQGGQTVGYIYVILLSEARDLVARGVAGTRTLSRTLAWMVIVASMGILVGAIALRRITRPLRALSKSMQELDVDGLASREASLLPNQAPASDRDEIAVLKSAYNRMAARIADQWRALRQQDEQRRELVANVSHDLRTPLTSLQGYLELLETQHDALSETERHRYLSAARALSEKLSSLARELLELARLEHDAAALQKEPFSILDLVQDVFEKLFVLAEERGQTLEADAPGRVPNVVASVALIERVLTNLLDNAIRHTPEGSTISVLIAYAGDTVSITIVDNGPGLSRAARDTLEGREHEGGSEMAPGYDHLGLRIVRRILELHGSRIEIGNGTPTGTSIGFSLQAAGVSPRPIEA